MRLAISLCVALLMFNGTEASLSQEREKSSVALSELTKWQGKYLFEKVGGQKLTANPGLKNVLNETMGEVETKRFLFYTEHGPSNPIGVVDGHVFLDACEAHNCYDEHFTVIVDTKASRAFVCRSTERSRAKDEVTWQTAGRSKVTAKDCSVEGEPGPAYYRRLLNLVPRSLRD